MNAKHKSVLLGGLAALVHAPVWAHEGHGLWGSHWHASDVMGLGLLALVAIAWLAMGRRK